MKTILEVECAVLNYLDERQNLVVPNVSWGIKYNKLSLHECDVLCLSKDGYATEYEIKTSKQDLLKDKDKEHGHKHPLIRRLYFAVPSDLLYFAKENLPENIGIISCFYTKKGVPYAEHIRHASINSYAVKWDDVLRLKLLKLGCMRLKGFKLRELRRKRKINESKI
jgi:hypothetical protein